MTWIPNCFKNSQYLPQATSIRLPTLIDFYYTWIGVEIYAFVLLKLYKYNKYEIVSL